MNIFEQYGIKEVADVTLYSIELDENDDEVYVPVMYLDTLKVSTVEETAEQVAARGGLGNPELIIWDFGKEITITLEDALYTPASQAMLWGGKHGSKTTQLYGYFIRHYFDAKGEQIEGADKKVKAHFTIENFDKFRNRSGIVTGGYKSEYNWRTNGKVVSEDNSFNYYVENVGLHYKKDEQEKENFGFSSVTTIANNWDATGFIDHINVYLNIPTEDGTTKEVVAGEFYILPDINLNATALENLIYEIDNGLENVEYLDRMEKCKASQTFCIDTDRNTEHSNFRYLSDYAQCELTVFVDPKTMLPFEPNTTEYTRKNGKKVNGNLRIIKQHEVYYKWTRTKSEAYTSLGHQVIVDAIHFPGTYRLVGETYSRSRRDGKDQRFQIEIPLCKMGTNNNLTLEAAGDPTTFTMTLKALRREDGVMVKLTQYSVEQDNYDGYESGSTKVIPVSEVVPQEPSYDIPTNDETGSG